MSEKYVLLEIRIIIGNSCQIISNIQIRLINYLAAPDKDKFYTK